MVIYSVINQFIYPTLFSGDVKLFVILFYTTSQILVSGHSRLIIRVVPYSKQLIDLAIIV
jgi:hypothetical protein